MYYLVSIYIIKFEEGSSITNIKSEQKNITLSNEERLSIIEDILNAKEHTERLQCIIFGLLLAFISFSAFRVSITFLGILSAIPSVMFFIASNSNLHSKVFKDVSSDIDKINAFIYYTNSEACGKKITNGEFATPIYIPGNKYASSRYLIQPLLKIDNLDIFLTSNCTNLMRYRVDINPLEYFYLKKLLRSSVEKFNNEIILRGYDIKPYEQFKDTN